LLIAEPDEMTSHKNNAFSSGFRLLWRRQGVLWWIFAVNLLCGALGTVPGFLRLQHALGHSLAGQPLTNRFDLGMLAELFRLPDVSLVRYTTNSYLFAFIFFVFILFVTGGILESYRADRRLTTGEFFAASGAYFWRFVRLLLLSIIPFVIVIMIYQALDKAADRIGDRAIADQAGIFLGWGAMLIFLLLALAVRLWFDMAQVRAVAHNERRMWRNTWRAWRITWHGFGRLYGMYFVIALVGWIMLAIGLVIWAQLPATATGAVFIILELIMLAQIATRLWQLAGAMSWYQAHAEILAPPVEATATPMPLETAPAAAGAANVVYPPQDAAAVEPPPAEAPEPPSTDPGPELPPADA